MPVYRWSLWGVRRADLDAVWCAGFHYVRPPYPAAEHPEYSGTWTEGSQTYYFDHTDNYSSTLNYAARAQQIGFTKLIYDLGLKYLYEQYRRTVLDPNYGVGNPNIPRSIQEIRDEVSRRIEYMSTGGVDRVTGQTVVLNSIVCHPYLDEPDYFPQEKTVVEGVTLWENYTAGIRCLENPTEYGFRDYRHALNDLRLDTSACKNEPYNAINRDLITEFRDLVSYAAAVASNYGRTLYIATTTPDIVRRCNPPSQDCSNIRLDWREDFACYHYNSLSNIALMSSLYETAADMNPILNAIQSNYNKPVQQLINFWDYFYGCRYACTVQEIIDQINVNTQFTGGENWFYQGDYIYLHKIVNGYDSFLQWQKLRQALASFGNQERCPVPE